MNHERRQGAKSGLVRAAEPLLRPRPALKPVLESVGATAKLFTKCEVESHLNEYISRRKLYDPQDPNKIHCENDILEKAFGCKEFNTENVCELLLMNLEAVSDTSDMEQSLGITIADKAKKPLRKRRRESAPPEDTGSQSEAGSSPDIPWCIGFITPGTESSDSESSGAVFCLYKGYDTAETAVVEDSEDDLFFLDEEEREDRFSIEYEPPESGSEEDEEDEEEQQFDILPTNQVLSEEDPGAEGGDEFDENGDTDSEIDEEDMWRCQSCSTENYPITQRCAKCWIQRHERRTFSQPASLPRPGNRIDFAVRRSISDTGAASSASCSTSVACESERGQQERPLSSMDTPQDFLSLPSGVSSDSGFSSHPSSDILHPTLGSLVLNQAQDKIKIPKITRNDSSEILQCDEQEVAVQKPEDLFGEMCVVCLTQPRNASIVHGETGHQVCCFTCADKLRIGKRKCPVCREKIQMVIKNYF